MKKKPSLLWVFLIFILLIFSKSIYALEITINGSSVQYTSYSGFPFIDASNRMQVPLRQTMEAYGCSVYWDATNYIATVIKNDIIVKVPIGAGYIIKNDRIIRNDTVATIKDGRTYLPIRVVLEAFDATVNWNSLYQSVEVVDNNLLKPNTNVENSIDVYEEDKYNNSHSNKEDEPPNNNPQYYKEDTQYNNSESPSNNFSNDNNPSIANSATNLDTYDQKIRKYYEYKATIDERINELKNVEGFYYYYGSEEQYNKELEVMIRETVKWESLIEQIRNSTDPLAIMKINEYTEKKDQAQKKQTALINSYTSTKSIKFWEDQLQKYYDYLFKN